LIFEAINAELAGEEWQVPPMLEENPYTRRVEEIRRVEEAKEEKEEVPPMFVPLVLSPCHSC
jgi:hypothetical protein